MKGSFKLSQWGPPLVGNCVRLASPSDQNLFAYFFFYEFHLFNAIEKGKLVPGDWEWVVDDDGTAAHIHAESLKLEVDPTHNGAELDLEIMNDTDHDWPSIASIVPCFHAGNPRNPPGINPLFQDVERTHSWFYGESGLEQLKIPREIHYNHACRSEIMGWDGQREDQRFVFEKKDWPTSGRDAHGGLMIRESNDGRYVMGIGWEAFLLAQAHNPMNCMHLSIKVGPLARGEKKTIRGRISSLKAPKRIASGNSRMTSPEKSVSSVSMNLKVDNTASPRGFSVAVGEPFTVCTAREGEVIVHPHLTHLGDGELLLRISPDPDMWDEEEYILSSGDGGRTWEAIPDWPMNDGAGRHLYQQHTRLPDGRSLVVSIYLFATGKKNEYIIPAWISSEDGRSSFTKIESLPFQFPFGTTVDWCDPVQWPAMRRGGPRNHEENFLTDPGKPSKLMEAFLAEYGRNGLAGHTLPLYPLDDTTVLAFVTASPGYVFEPRKAEGTCVCLESTDWGRSWAVRSVPGPWVSALEEKNRRKKSLDGFCEPSVTCLRNGDHLIIMRIGAWQRLYSARSTDQCRTWSKPREISVFGILPTVLTLPDGVLALATGRPDNTLSFSFDDGESWPWTYRLLDQTNPLHPSTRNSTMIQVAPGRLLYLYDYGYRRPDKDVNVPHSVEGRFMEVSTTT